MYKVSSNIWSYLSDLYLCNCSVDYADLIGTRVRIYLLCMSCYRIEVAEHPCNVRTEAVGFHSTQLRVYT